MTRYRLTLEYDGGPFVGWQRQDNGLSVQLALEDAVRATVQEDCLVYGAGRTDAGVHALAQVAHVDIAKEIDPQRLMAAINFHVRPHPVSVTECSIAVGDFHARFSAVGRAYLYRIVNRRAPLALMAGKAWRVPQKLDAEAMDEAAQRLVGCHDFTTFRSTHCQAKNPNRTIDRLDVSRSGDLIEIRVSAQSFLHNQIRSFAGTLKMVGEGKWTSDDVGAALAARDRTRCGPVAPPWGLFFMQVEYGDLSKLLRFDDPDS